MDGYRSDTYGEAFADVYDEWYGDLNDAEVVADRLAELTPSGSVLELGVGTGRLAAPLAARGIVVVGIDASRAMLRGLRYRTRHTEGAPLPVRGDMARLPLAPNAFETVFVAYNTLFNLPDTGQQELCLRDVARCLVAGGALVIEAFVPATEDPASQGISVRHVTTDAVVLTASKLDRHAQTIAGQHIEVRESGIRLRPWFLHYLDPAQVDALAERVGLRLESRAAGWHAEPFTDDSESHVSVYRRSMDA